MTLLYDAVVAGSGAGGACVAGRLAAGGMKVLLIERGRRPRPGAAAAVVRRHYARGALTAAWGRGLLPVPTGSALGGTTAINSGTCLRPPPELTRAWEKASGGAFSSAAFARRVEQAWGALKVKRAPEATLSGSSRLALEGFRALGVPAQPLERAEEGCAGEGRCCFVCPRGAKMTADKAFLAPLGPKGPELWIGAELESLAVLKHGGVRVAVGRDGRREALETALVVLACGALETPALVRRHRLGAWGLAGDNLSLHPALKLFALFPEPVSPAGVPQGVGAVHPADPAVRLEGVATPPELTALTMPLEGVRLRWWMERRTRLATFGLMVKDAARGTVRHPLGRRWPLLRYAPAPEDLRGLARGLALAADAFFAAGAQRVLLPLNRPGNEAGSAEEAAAILASLSAAELQAMAFHPLGTCAMGRVVGPDLRLAPGVYAADGSVVPESLGVNPQVTIYAFALGLSGRLLGEGP